MKTQVLTVMMTGALLSTVAYADSIGRSSNPAYIQVGGTEWVGGNASNGHIGEPGSPGIGVHTSKTPFKRVSLNRLQWLAGFGLGGSYNIFNGLTQLQEDHWAMPVSHNEFGHYAFKKMSKSGADVYFGEWSDEGDFTDNTHTVYYVGKDKTTNMPNNGKFKYNVEGINNAGNDGLMNSSNFVADFSQNTLTGSMKNGRLTIGVNSVINPATASFSGTASASGRGITESINGVSRGEFFGNNAAALGGIATFTGNSQYDTAFAGTKDTK